MNGTSRRSFLAMGVATVSAASVAGIASYFVGQAQTQSTQAMSSLSAAPPVKGFYNRQEILFIHTEASDEKVAEMLTMMMGAKVIVVPSLAQIQGGLLGDVYVFTNGVKGGGPMGFQPDIFNTVPGDKEYTPLRTVNLATWKPGMNAKELRSIEEIKTAEASGELTVSRPGAVVNMPIISWPGGHR